MDSATAEEISRRFLPSRWHYHYVRIKLGTDPLYAAVTDALSGTQAPLLDLGCGVGLLAHCAHARSLSLEYFGIDNDFGKIALACLAAERGRLANTRFGTGDVAELFPQHRGSVAMLDILQYLPPEQVAGFLGKAAACVTETGRLVIRTGLQDAGWRTRVTRTADVLARTIRWMNLPPQSYPTREFLGAALEAHGLQAEFTPLWGNTPFNNWLIVARRVR